MVYVIQRSDRDLRMAEKFGELYFLLPAGSQVTFSAGVVTQHLRSQLSKFNDEDFLVLIGDPVAIGISVAVACSWNKGRTKLLKWDREQGVYYPVQVDIYNKGGVDGIPA